MWCAKCGVILNVVSNVFQPLLQFRVETGIQSLFWHRQGCLPLKRFCTFNNPILLNQLFAKREESKSILTTTSVYL